MGHRLADDRSNSHLGRRHDDLTKTSEALPAWLDYNQIMLGPLRTAIGAMLAVAFATAPIILDRCAASCDLAHATEATTATLTCHHSTATTVRVGRVPRGCGHDHSSLVTTLTVSAAPHTPLLAPLGGAMTGRTPGNIASVTRFTLSLASPPHVPLSRRLSVSLRT
jgi:hypothetical protein